MAKMSAVMMTLDSAEDAAVKGANGPASDNKVRVSCQPLLICTASGVFFYVVLNDNEAKMNT